MARGLTPLWRCCALACFSVLSALPGSAVELRFWSLPDMTRIAVPTDGEAPVQSDHLINPDRVFFDIRSTKLLAHRRKMQTINVGDTLVKQIRVAETQPGVTRVVCDLTGPAEIRLSQLSNPDRVIIELRRATGGVPTLAPAPLPRLISRGRRMFIPPFARFAEAPTQFPPLELIRPVVFTAHVSPEAGLYQPAIAFPRWSGSTARVLRASAPKSTVARRTQPKELPPPAARESENASMAKRTSEGDRTLARVLGLKLNRIVIDAGHGGHDAGTTGPTGLMEKDLVLDVALRLGALVEQRLKSQVLYTRADDTFIPLEKRTELANLEKADLFLSVHANSSPERSASGVETYYLNFTTSQDALDTAARENAGAQSSMYDLNDLIKKIALKNKVDESREFAALVQNSLFSLSSQGNPRAKDRGVRKAPFVVLIGAQMPSVLAEIGFVSNPYDEAQMKRLDMRQKIAEALYKGVAAYAATLSHFQVAQQSAP